MTQRRYIEYGTPATSQIVRATQAALHIEGPYYGLDLAANAAGDALDIYSGFLMLPYEDGELVELASDDPLEPALSLDFDPPVGAPPGGAEYFAYTLVCIHSVIEVLGGQPAVFSLEVNPVDPTVPLASVVGGVIVGWIFHPGSSVPLTNDMILQAPRMRNSDSLTIVRDTRPDNYSAQELEAAAWALSIPGSTMTHLHQFVPGDGFEIYIANPGPLGPTDYIDTYLQLPAHGRVPMQINIEAWVPSLASIAVDA